MLAALVLAMSTQPSVMATGPRFLPRFAYYGTLAATDLATTELCLARGCAEGNPLMRDRAVRTTFHVAAAVGLAKLDQWLDRRGHHGLAWVGRVGFGAGAAAVAVHNLRVRHRP
jgi:hypothetical protein